MTLCFVTLVELCGPLMLPLLSIMSQYLQLVLVHSFLFVGLLSSAFGAWLISHSLYTVRALTRWGLMFLGRLYPVMSLLRYRFCGF